MRPAPASFRQRLLAGEPLLGTFIKTPTVHTTEIIGSLGFDFVVTDQEHAPFDRVTTDLILLAALDDGAQGIVVPHVATAGHARAVVAAARYRGGRRGFSNSPRAGGYGRAGVWEHVDASDAATAVIAMVEDPQALDRVDEIAAVDGLDALFIGRGDLTAVLQAEAVDAPPVRAAVERIASAARTHHKPLCAHAGRIDTAELRWLRGLGISCFIVGSDQGYLRSAAAEAQVRFRELTSAT